jgi:hypothetical protein
MSGLSICKACSRSQPASKTIAILDIYSGSIVTGKHDLQGYMYNPIEALHNYSTEELIYHRSTIAKP